MQTSAAGRTRTPLPEAGPPAGGQLDGPAHQPARALRVTRVVAPWGVSANMATLAAWGCGVAAAAAFGWGTVWRVARRRRLLQLWYLLDHVDGQLARLRGTASLDGVQLDYLMHHTVNLLVPLGVGFGLFARGREPLWLLAGLVWGVSLLADHACSTTPATRRSSSG